MKTKRWIGLFLCLLFCVSLLPAISQAEIAVDVAAEELVGEWKLYKATAMGQTLTSEQLQAEGVDLSFTLNGDGSAAMVSNGSTANGLSWREESGELTLSYYSDDSITLTYDGSDMILNIDETTLYFSKSGTSTPTPTATPTPSPEPATVKKVQAKKSLKLQAPKIKKAAYQWMYRTGKVGPWQSLGKKGTKQKLSVKATMAMDGYQYRCRVTSPTGAVSYTDIYELYVYEQLKVKKQPKWGKASLPGAKMPLTITAQGASSYQWVTRPNGSSPWTRIEGATGTSYVVDVQEGMAGRQYACQVTGKQGTVMSKAATVKMAKIPAPKIKKQPVLKKPVAPGTVVTLKVTAINTETYQWYYRTSANGAWIIYSGATQPTLTFTVGAGTNGYQYKCTVKSRGGSVDSKPVTLKVVTP